MDRSKFYAALRARTSGVFGSQFAAFSTVSEFRAHGLTLRP